MPTDPWWNFFYLCGSSAVTLTGLMFVAVTLGSTLIHKDNLDRVHAFLSPICFHFLHVFFLCCAFAVPGAHPHLLAGAAILSALWRLTMRMPKTYAVVHAEAQKDQTDIDFSDWVIVVFLPIIVYVVLIVTGVGFWCGQPWAVYTLAASCLVLLLSATKGAWDTLIWIAAALR
jgi:hypothetical protein